MTANDLLRELMQATLATSAAIVLLLALRRPLRARFGARLAYGAWLLVPVAMIAVWLPAASAPTVAEVGTGGFVRLSHLVWVERVETATVTLEWGSALLASWAFGALGLLSSFVARQHSFSRNVSRHRGRAFDTVEGQGPAVVGWWRSRIVLPEDFRERYTRGERRLVLAHEIAHLRKGDIHAQAIATALRCLFWFNPLVHAAAEAFRFDQELACDAAVLEKFPRGRGRYGSAMLKTQLAVTGLPVGCHWQSSHAIKERIQMLKQPLPARTRKISGSILVAMIIGCGTWAAWAAQPVGTPTVPKQAATTQTAARQTVAKQTPATDEVEDLHYIGPMDNLPAPTWPKGVKEEGSVVVELLVGTDGKVKDVKIVSSKPAGVFDQAAMDAARTWTIHPAIVNGVAVEKRYRTQIDFSLHGDPEAKK
jgi:TonB family protein